jgi:hypothetical protein
MVLFAWFDTVGHGMVRYTWADAGGHGITCSEDFANP